MTDNNHHPSTRRTLPVPVPPTRELMEWVRAIRREIHAYPELAFQEYQTARLIQAKLQELRISFTADIGGTGIIAEIPPKPEPPGSHCPTIALRADMDALPIEEKTGLPFSSKTAGVMHACGHDGHVAMLLGAAALIRQTSRPMRTLLIFQPAEEQGTGAKEMLASGKLDGVDAIFACHLDRHVRTGDIAVQPGLICAYTDEFFITICGHGGHAARPHETVDSIVVASLLVSSIQTLVSREVNPAYPSVVSVGRIKGGTAPNVIAEEAVLEGTIRCTHPEVRAQIISGLNRMVGAMATLYNARTTITFGGGLPPVVNAVSAAAMARSAAVDIIGEEHVTQQPHPSLGGEDFAYYSTAMPGCLVRLGAGRSDCATVPAHSPMFDFDEDALSVGTAFLARVALVAGANDDWSSG